ncbi:Putative ribonuclease H protein At1g65750, partial [Linum perenne]
ESDDGAPAYELPAQGSSYQLETGGAGLDNSEFRWVGSQWPCIGIDRMATREESGRVIYEAAQNLGQCSITRVEIKGAVDEMMAAWDLGIRRLEVQIDSSSEVSILLQGNLSHQHASLVTRFQKLREREWELRIKHIYREANHLADCLADKGHSLPCGSTTRLKTDVDVRKWETYDARGVTEVRCIRSS